MLWMFYHTDTPAETPFYHFSGGWVFSWFFNITLLILVGSTNILHIQNIMYIEYLYCNRQSFPHKLTAASSRFLLPFLY